MLQFPGYLRTCLYIYIYMGGGVSEMTVRNN